MIDIKNGAASGLKVGVDKEMICERWMTKITGDRSSSTKPQIFVRLFREE
jgi:hypothetical protein